MRESRVRSIVGLAAMAALVCLLILPAVAYADPVAPDSYEPDDSPAQAVTISTNGVKQEHSLYPAYDIDWQQFTAVAGHRYLIQTGPGAPEPTTNRDFYIRLYAADGTTELAYNDDAGPDNYSYLYWTATTSGTLYVKNHAYGYYDYIGFYAIRVTDLTSSGARIAGTVRAAGAPAPGATIWVTSEGDPWLTALDSGFKNYDSGKTLADGTYNMGVVEGTQTVSFGGDRYFTQWYDGVSTEASATQFFVAFGATRTGVDANLALKPTVERVAGYCTVVSVNTTGTLGNDDSEDPAVSTTGRYVAFESYASNLWAGDFSGEWSDQIYVRDRATGVTTRESRAADGAIADSQCWQPDISGDGRYVVFASDAGNLPGAPDDGTDRIFLRDRASGETTCVSVRPDGVPTTSDSDDPSISEDGRYVAYDSYDDGLVANDNNSLRDVFVWDRTTGTTVRASVDAEGVEGDRGSRTASINGNGRYVAFMTGNAWAPGDVESGKTAEVDVYVKDLVSGSVVRASEPATDTGIGMSLDPSISRDGRRVAFESEASWLVADDTNGEHDIFLRDLDTSSTVCVSRTISGAQSNDSSWDPAISGDGRTVVFASSASNLVANDNNESDDVFVRDYTRGKFGMVSISADNMPGGDDSDYGAAISDDGGVIAFGSNASNLVADDTNGSTDVFAAAYPYVPPAPPVAAPTHSLSRPWTRYAVRRGVSFEVWGWIRPQHATTRRGLVAIKAYRLERGRWVLKKTFTAATLNRSYWRLSTKYAQRIRLTLKGSYKIVATHPNGDGTTSVSLPRFMFIR